MEALLGGLHPRHMRGVYFGDILNFLCTCFTVYSILHSLLMVGVAELKNTSVDEKLQNVFSILILSKVIYNS